MRRKRDLRFVRLGLTYNHNVGDMLSWITAKKAGVINKAAR